jgi:hypothetical protein
LASLVTGTVPKFPKLASKSSYVISSHVPADCNDRSFQEITGLVALFTLIFPFSECAAPDDDVGWILTQSKSIKQRRKAKAIMSCELVVV